MRKSLRYLTFAGVVFFLLSGCSTLTTHPAAAEKPDTPAGDNPASEPSPKLPAVELTPDLLYQLMAAEIAGQRGHLEQSAVNYLRVAYATRDPRIARRATRIAIYARDFKLAAEASQLWVEIAPDDPEARQSLAALLIREGRTDAALTHLEKLLQISAGAHERGFALVTSLLSREQDKKRALAVMERLVAPRQKDPDALYAYAHLASIMGEQDKASEILDRVFAIKPDWSRALALKAQVLRRQGHKEEALATFKKAVDTDPKNTNLRLAYARVLVDAKQLKEAREQFQILSDQMPSNADVTYALGLLALEANDLDEAERQFGRLLTSGRHTDAAAYSLGQIAEQRDRWEQAIKWYSAVGEGDNYLDARVRIAVLLAKHQGLEKARRYLRSVQVHAPDDEVRLYLVEGELLRDAGRNKDAKAVYDEALQQYPDHPDVLYARAMVEERLGRVDLLEADLRRIIELDPDNAQALNALGYTLADQTKRYKEAYGYIKKALDQEPDDPAVMDSMGWVLYRMGRLEASRDYLQRAFDQTKDPEIAAHLGEVLWKLGRKDEARKVWDEALKEEGGHKFLQQTIQRLTQ
jgi:tetratricopeptide (TPR) repeat protein